MFVFNSITPYIMDDYWYMYNYEGTSRIKNIIDIFFSLKEMYFHWGGRILAHFFAYFFLMFPKWIFNIVNSIVYVLNVYLIYLICRGNNKDNYKYLLLIHMIIFLFFPVMGQVFLWLDGSCNYSFTLLFQLFFIYKIIHVEGVNKRKYFLYFIISLLAGMCNENSSLSLILFLVLYALYDRSYMKLKVVSFMGLFMGYLFMILAPGNYVRTIHHGYDSFLSSVFTNFFGKFFLFISNFWPILIGMLLFVIVFIMKDKKKGLLCFIFYLSSLVALFSLIASPQLLSRSFTMLAVYLLIITLIMVFHVNRERIKMIFFHIITILFIFVAFNTTMEYLKYYHFISQRDTILKDAVKSHETKIYVERYRGNGNCRVPINCDLVDVSDNYEDTTTNIFMSKYYGIKIYGYDGKDVNDKS